MCQIKFKVNHSLIFYGMQEHFVHLAICKQIKGIQFELQGKVHVTGYTAQGKR